MIKKLEPRKLFKVFFIVLFMKKEMLIILFLGIFLIGFVGAEDCISQGNGVYLCKQGQVFENTVEISKLTEDYVVIKTFGNLKESVSDPLYFEDEYFIRNKNLKKQKITIGEIEVEEGEFFVLVLYGNGIEEKESESRIDIGNFGDCNSSCAWFGECYDYGYRKNFKSGNIFCSKVSGKFIEQYDYGEYCENNFECKSNYCEKNECTEKGFFRKILVWFRRIF